MAERPNKRQRNTTYTYREDGTFDGDGDSNTTYVPRNLSFIYIHLLLIYSFAFCETFSSFVCYLEHVTLHFGRVACCIAFNSPNLG